MSHKVTDAGESASNSGIVNASFCLLGLVAGGLLQESGCFGGCRWNVVMGDEARTVAAEGREGSRL